MATIKHFEEIEAWQKARKFANKLFEVFQRSPACKDFALKDQINRSTGSVMDNIAEGFERGGNKEFTQFLSISKGSVGEAKSQLYRTLDRNYVTKDEFDHLQTEAMSIGQLIGGMMVYLRNSDFKGPKYHEPPSQYSKRKIRRTRNHEP